MKKISFFISVGLMFIFWPLSFFLANTQNWPLFAAAPLVLLFDWFLYLKKFKYHYFLYLILPIIHPVYIFFPIFVLLINVRDIKKPILLLVYLVILLGISLASFRTLYTNSIFIPDPLATDTLIKKISLIPNRNLARIFVNKSTVPIDKYKANIFTSFDQNNYFFSLHPREMGDNQNLSKFPFLAIIPFLFGLFLLPQNKHKNWVVIIFLASVFSIGFTNNQDKFDTLLFIPVSLLCFYGLKSLMKSSDILFWIFSIIFIPVSLIELARIFVFK